MELNPRHPTTQAAREQWHKLLAIVMHKYKMPHIVVTTADIEALGNNANIAIQSMNDGIHLRLVDIETAKKLAKEHGGEFHVTDN